MRDNTKPSEIYAAILFFTFLVNIPLCFVFIGLFLLMPLGAWHVIDALIRVMMGDKRRIPYLIVVLLYFILLTLMTSWRLVNGNYEYIVFVIPYLIGFWYCYITWAHAREDAGMSDE